MPTLRQVALDTETTGKAEDGTPGDHRIIEIGCVEIVERRFTKRSYQVYLNPDREVDPEATRVHGWTWDMLRDKEHFADIAQDLVEFLRGAEVLIHNAAFDVGFLDKEFMLAGLDYRMDNICQVVDTLKLARELLPGKMVSLDHLCNQFGVDRTRRVKHGALLDAELLGEVYLAMTRSQGSFNFSESHGTVQSTGWQRPGGVELPLMAVESEAHARHVLTEAAYAVAARLYEAADGTAMGGTTWGPEYDVPLLNANEGESPKELKSRRKKQAAELAARLLADTPDLIEKIAKADADAFKYWEKRLFEGIKVKAGIVINQAHGE